MPPAPAAATITIRDTLAMLDDPKREVADGVANGRYIFWLGSGISRDKMPDLREVAKKVMQELQARSNPTDANCKYRQALTKIVTLAGPSPEELKHVDYAKHPNDWGGIFDTFATRLTANYSKMLNVTVDKEDDDFLLWDILNLAKVYSDPHVEPDAEHLSAPLYQWSITSVARALHQSPDAGADGAPLQESSSIFPKRNYAQAEK